ncbi:translin-associated factor X [Columba livia]|uniref:Translin-associated protein X n=2 Tax=Columba livia TaxID=8932 RepID=A0A2I0MTS9_COLLI|nr:translin-associated factor X [Columba livia]
MSRRAAGVGGLTARPQASCPRIACSESSSALGFTPISRATRPDIILRGAIASHHSCLFAGDGPAHSACVASCCQAPARASCCGSRSGGFRKRKHDNFPHGQRREEKENVNPSSALMMSFKSFQLELDTRHDKYERLVKLSRDITIESKRTIFLLHRFISAPNGEEILNESEVKLDAVRRKIKQVAQELIGEDMYQFHRAISPGLQEYVEAVSFQYFIKTRSLISVEEINKQLIFTAEDREETTNMTSNSHDKQPHTCSLKVTPVDYLLGVADLTGELMRLCISSVGNGDIDTPFELSQFLRQIYDGFTFIGNTGPYEVSKKLYTLKQSLAKVENACYTLKVRGSEIPKHMLADVFSTKTELIDQEEGLS